MKEQHEMLLETTHPSGEEEWYCPACGRRMMVNWTPKFKRRVLEAGDENVSHSGSKGGMHMGKMNVKLDAKNVAQKEPEMLIEDERLAPWITWLNETDFDNRWDNHD